MFEFHVGFVFFTRTLSRKMKFPARGSFVLVLMRIAPPWLAVIAGKVTGIKRCMIKGGIKMKTLPDFFVC